jgi:hypothetical protein
MPTSYKFALWRALASLGPNTDERNPTVFKHDLAPLFLKYFWPLEVKYHSRQSTDPDRDPIVMKLVRRLQEAGKIEQGETLREFENRTPEEYRAVVSQIARCECRSFRKSERVRGSHTRSCRMCESCRPLSLETLVVIIAAGFASRHDGLLIR